MSEARPPLALSLASMSSLSPAVLPALTAKAADHKEAPRGSTDFKTLTCPSLKFEYFLSHRLSHSRECEHSSGTGRWEETLWDKVFGIVPGRKSSPLGGHRDALRNAALSAWLCGEEPSRPEPGRRPRDPAGGSGHRRPEPRPLTGSRPLGPLGSRVQPTVAWHRGRCGPREAQVRDRSLRSPGNGRRRSSRNSPAGRGSAPWAGAAGGGRGLGRARGGRGGSAGQGGRGTRPVRGHSCHRPVRAPRRVMEGTTARRGPPGRRPSLAPGWALSPARRYPPFLCL